jgi:cbb3-type cytochrome oxidase subunit 3
MKSQVLAYYNMPFLSNLGLIIFLTVFVGMLFWVFQRSRKPIYDHIAALPLQEDS